MRATRRGFTLIESIAVITILAAIAASASGIILTGADGYARASAANDLQTQASMALDRIVRELRSVPLDSTASGIAPDIDGVTPTTIDWNSGYAVELSEGVIKYTEPGSPARKLLDGVTAFSITSYDEANATLGGTLSGDACDPIRRLAFSITVEARGVTRTASAKIFLRATMGEGA